MGGGSRPPGSTGGGATAGAAASGELSEHAHTFKHMHLSRSASICTLNKRPHLHLEKWQASPLHWSLLCLRQLCASIVSSASSACISVCTSAPSVLTSFVQALAYKVHTAWAEEQGV